jgi:hypothetical protein
MAISDTSSTPSSVVVKQEPEDVLSLRMPSGRGSTSQNAIELMTTVILKTEKRMMTPITMALVTKMMKM